MAVLATILVPSVSAYIKKANAEKIKTNLMTFYSGAETVNGIEDGFSLKTDETASDLFKEKTGYYSGVEDENELERYLIGRSKRGIYVEYHDRDGNIHVYPKGFSSENVNPPISEERSDFIKSATVIPYSLWDINMVKSKVNSMKLNTVNVAVRVIVDGRYDNDMRLHEGDMGHAENLIKELNKMDVDVIIEPFPWIENGSVVETHWKPTNINSWFWNWKTKVLFPMIERLAEPLNAEYFTVSNNFVHMEYATGYWTDLFREVKEKFSGEIIYKTNWWLTAEWEPSTIAKYNQKLNNSLFGSSDLDVISIGAYFELTDKANPSVAHLKETLKGTTKFNRNQNVYQEIMNFSSKWNKKMMFGELGAPKYDGYAAEPWNPNPTGYGGKLNNQAQYNYFKAYIETFGRENWYNGFSIFTIGDSNSAYNITSPNIMGYIAGL